MIDNIQERIAYHGSWNLAVQIVGNLYSSKDNEDVKASIERWQLYFYDKLTNRPELRTDPAEIEASIQMNPVPTVAEWEHFSEQEKARRQEIKRSNNRANSAARKVEVKETNFEVRDIE